MTIDPTTEPIVLMSVLKDENENLRRLVDAHKIERNRLRSTLLSLRDWDMLTLDHHGHGVVTSDAPWARKLIADALSEEVTLPAPPPIYSGDHEPNPGPTIMGGRLALCRICTEKLRKNAKGEWEHFDVGRPYEPMEIK